MLTASIQVGVGIAIAALAYKAVHLPPAPTPIIDATIWPIGWPHEAPDKPMSPADAHLTMQRHCDCNRAACPRKNAAYATLVATGHIVPDTGRTR